MKATERTWEISDIDGSNPRSVTLAQYRAELDAAKAKSLAAFKSAYPTLGAQLTEARR